MTDWVGWHEQYRDPDSGLSHRLAEVQRQIRAAVRRSSAAPYRLLDLCAGQGEDLTGALAGDPAAAGIRARLIELDPHNLSLLVPRAAALGPDWEVVAGDAADTRLYAGVVPADLVMLCGVFGNIPDGDVFATIAALPELCRTGGEVIWTRHRREPDLTPGIRAALTAARFSEVAFVAPEDAVWSVGVHRHDGPGRPLRPRRLFSFSGP